jgi:AraC-like DNA-binding protein
MYVDLPPSRSSLQRPKQQGHLKTVHLKSASLGLLQDVIGVQDFGGSGSASPLVRERLRRAALDSLKRLVEQNLDSPALSTGFVCARSGWSRATVYRLFEVEGGLARYIRKRHLLRAFRELTSGRAPHLRIVDLALAHQFASEATFNRAFRRAFGIPPGKVRDLTEESSRAVALSEGRRRTARRLVAASASR